MKALVVPEEAKTAEPNSELARLQQENAGLRAELARSRSSQAAETSFRLLAEAIPQLVWTCRPDGRCNYLGPQWVAYTGTPEAEQLGYGWLEKLHPDDRERVDRDWASAAAAGHPLDVDFRIRRVDGVYRWFKTRALPARDAEGRIIQWLGTNTDIEELRAAEQEVRRLTVGLEMQVSQRTAELGVTTERLVAATKGAGIGIWDWDIAKDSLVWDEQISQLYGLTSAEFSGSYETWRNAIHVDDEPHARQAILDALAGIAEYRIKFRILTPAGLVRHIQAVATVYRDEAGNAVRMLGANWDITAETVAQEQLRINEERWNLALEGTGDGVWDWDLVKGKVFFSHRSGELLGHRGEEVCSVDERTDLLHPDDLSKTRQAMENHLQGQSPVFECEYRLRRRDGSYAWILGRGRVIARDACGKPLRVVGTHKDIAERHRAQEALESRERLLREFITHTPAAIAILDRELRYVQASRRWLRDYKLQGQDIIGRSHYDVFPDIPQRWKDVHQRVLAGAVESCDEDPFPRADGGTEWLQWEARPWHESDGTIGGLIFFTQVITERKELGLKLEEQNYQLLRSNDELEQFAYVASHDLQEPLRAIAGCTQILAQRYRGQLDEQADRLVAHIVDGAERMKALIEGLLSLSRVSAQQLPADSIDLTSICQQALGNLRASLREQEAIVNVGPLPRVRGDATQLLQLLQNLLGNALKYRRAESPRVNLTAKPAFDGYQFSVQDNGIGIETQYFERIFGVFQRLHTREEYPGTGIGLAICRKIVERHGGRMWLESVLGKGTTFHFTLPAFKAPS